MITDLSGQTALITAANQASAQPQGLTRVQGMTQQHTRHSVAWRGESASTARTATIHID